MNNDKYSLSEAKDLVVDLSNIHSFLTTGICDDNCDLTECLLRVLKVKIDLIKLSLERA